MTSVEDALTWTGTDARISIFVASADGATPSLLRELQNKDWNPGTVAAFRLDESEIVSGCVINEYDIRLETLPRDLSEFLLAILATCLQAGAVVAWLGFEGSFGYDHLLTADIAQQIYGIADASGIDLAIDTDSRITTRWVARLADGRQRLMSRST